MHPKIYCDNILFYALIRFQTLYKASMVRLKTFENLIIQIIWEQNLVWFQFAWFQYGDPGRKKTSWWGEHAIEANIHRVWCGVESMVYEGSIEKYVRSVLKKIVIWKANVSVLSKWSVINNIWGATTNKTLILLHFSLEKTRKHKLNNPLDYLV